MNELLKRVLFALIAAPIFVWLIVLGKTPFSVLMIVLTMGIQYEIVHIARKAGLRPNTGFTYLTGAWIALLPQFPDLLQFGFLLLVGLVVFETLSSNADNVQRLFSTFFCGLYAPAGLLAFRAIRASEPNELAICFALSTLLAIWGVDVFSYFGGRLFGKTPLAPGLSPNKTWEGFWSGFFVGGLAGIFLLKAGYLVFGQSFPLDWLALVPILFMAGTLGPIGDLAESKLKRSADVKDSGEIFPGHGGFFDRFDSLLVTAPAVLVYFNVVKAWL